MSYHSGQDPEENLPDWLRDLRKRQSQGTPDPENSEEDKPASTPESEEEPDWLREIRQRHGRGGLQQESTPPEEPESSGDTQPNDTQPSEAQPGETHLGDTQPIPASQAVEIRPQRQEPEPASPIEQSPEEQSGQEVPSRDFPDWLGELSQSEEEGSAEEPAAGHIPAFTEGAEEQLAPGELPSWLQAIRPEGVLAEDDSGPINVLSKMEETSGPLAGLSGVLPAQPDAIQSVKPPVYSARLELTDSHSQHVTALEKMLAEESKPAEKQGAAAPLPARLLNSLMAIALFISVLFPLLNQSRLAPRPEIGGFLQESKDVYDLIDVLPAQAPVLIGFDLQPGLYGETRAAVTAVLAHLLDRQARLVFISTQPTGPALAENLLQEEFASHPAVATGDYTNLGYLSGGMAALRSFFGSPRTSPLSATALGSNPWASPALQTIDNIADFALIVVVSSNADETRIWIEQGALEMPNGLIAITSAQAAPLLKPYLQSEPNTLRGLVSGVQGAVFYERLRSEENGDGWNLWDAYSFGIGAIILLVLLGGLYGRAVHMYPGRAAKHDTPEPNAPTATGSRSADQP